MMALYRLCRPRMAVSSSSSFQYLSTAALEQQTMATNNDGVNMMMNDEPETGARSIMTMKKNIRVSPKKLNLLAKQVRHNIERQHMTAVVLILIHSSYRFEGCQLKMHSSKCNFLKKRKEL